MSTETDEIGAIGGSAPTPAWAEPRTDVDATPGHAGPAVSPARAPATGEPARGELGQPGAYDDELGARGPQPPALELQRHAAGARRIVLGLPPAPGDGAVVLLVRGVEDEVARLADALVGHRRDLQPGPVELLLRGREDGS